MGNFIQKICILAIVPIITACFTVSPTVDMQQMKIPIANRQDLSVAIIAPSDVRDFNTAHEIQADCWSGGLQFAPAPYGETLVQTLHNRFSFMFSNVDVLLTPENLEDYDAIFKVGITDMGIKLACGISPNQYADVEGSLHAFRDDGSHLWSSSRTTGRDEGGMSYAMDFNRIYGDHFSKAIAALVDGWVAELIMTPPPKYAYNVDPNDYGTGGIFASNNNTNSSKRKQGFSTKPLKIKYRPVTPAPDDIVVIIGNANYGQLGKDIPNVIPAYSDASSMKKYALQALGVREGNIIDLQDATSAQMISVFGSQNNHKGQLYDWVKPHRSKVFVYYVGHGAPGTHDGTAYLVPVDADAARIDLNGYPLSVLYANLSKLNAQHVTVLLEACFSGTSNAGSLISNASPVYLQAKNTKIPGNLSVITAGSLNQIASWEEDKSNSLFTKYYLRGISGEADLAPYGNLDGEVVDAELKRYLDDTMTYFARRYYGREQNVQFNIAEN